MGRLFKESKNASEEVTAKILQHLNIGLIFTFLPAILRSHF